MGFIQKIINWFKGLFKKQLPNVPTNANQVANRAGVPTNANQLANKAGVPTNPNQAARMAGVPTNAQQAANAAGVPGNANQAARAAGVPNSMGNPAFAQTMAGDADDFTSSGDDQEYAATQAMDVSALIAADGQGWDPMAAAKQQAAGGGGTPGEFESPAHEEWHELQEFIGHCERTSLDLAGLDLNDPAGYWKRRQGIEEGQRQGRPKAMAIQQQGFQSENHWELAERYFTAKWSELIRNEEGEWEVRIKDEFTNAMLRAHQAGWQQQVEQTAATNPELMAPIEGVTLETYAYAQVALGSLPQGATPADIDQLLQSRFGISKDVWDRASQGWQDRMSQDTTYTLVTKYGQLFGQAQTGDPNAGTPQMGQGGGGGDQWNQGSWGQGGGGGGEPCTFEQYVEVMAAQTVWSQQGHDVNAMLPKHFGIDAMKYSAWSQYWGPKMGTDMALMRQYTELDAKYQAKWQQQTGGGAGSMDDDLSF